MSLQWKRFNHKFLPPVLVSQVYLTSRILVQVVDDKQAQKRSNAGVYHMKDD